MCVISCNISNTIKFVQIINKYFSKNDIKNTQNNIRNEKKIRFTSSALKTYFASIIYNSES